MATSLVFERAMASVNNNDKNSHFPTKQITNELDKMGVGYVADGTYWILKIKTNTRARTRRVEFNSAIHGYANEDDSFGGYLYRGKYYDSPKPLIKRLKKDIYYNRS